MENRRFNKKQDNDNLLNIKCNLSDILKDLINIGYGRNLKVLKYNDIKKIKNMKKEEDIFPFLSWFKLKIKISMSKKY